MKTTKYLLYTLKQDPSNTESISHKLMLRSGMIRQISSGIYTWLPTGIRVLNKIKKIIRNEMNKIGAIEILMPIMQPANLWKKSQRLDEYGPELFRIIDRKKSLFVLGPTHEEIITYLLSHEVISYKNLPIIFFQIQNKFRDEMRPRYGIMRSREFIMKDAYSFHNNLRSLEETYEKIFYSYKKILNKMNLIFKIVKADSGNIGGSVSHEFQVLSDIGEDKIIFSKYSNFATNIEVQKNLLKKIKNLKLKKKMIIIENKKLTKLNISIKKKIKIIILKAAKNTSYQLIAILLRGDHSLDKIKAEKLSIISKPLKLINEEKIFNLFELSSKLEIKPIFSNIPVIADFNVLNMYNFFVKSNFKNKYLYNANWIRDIPIPKIIEDISISNIKKQNNKNYLMFKKGIEVAHIFQLGTKYSNLMNLSIKNKYHTDKKIIMGCYGIGITRIISAIIEQNYDEKGIIWPKEIAPFLVAIIPINMYNSQKVRLHAENLYLELNNYGIDTILDDRKESFGVMRKDIELIGIPYIIILSHKNIQKNLVEYIIRKKNFSQFISLNNILNFIKTEIKNNI